MKLRTWVEKSIKSNLTPCPVFDYANIFAELSDLVTAFGVYGKFVLQDDHIRIFI